jgi:hypothetical protein
MQPSRLDPDGCAYQFGIFASCKVIARIDAPNTFKTAARSEQAEDGEIHDQCAAVKMIDNLL